MIEQNEEELKQFRVQAILSEYQALRNNILQKFHHHLQIYSLIITVFAVMFSYIFTEKNYDLLLLIPVISSAFAFRYIWEQNIIEIIGNYLKIMEDEILPEVIGYRDTDQNQRKYWVGWEHYFRNHFPRRHYYKYTIELLFVVIPIFPAVFYSIIVILKHFRLISIEINSFIPMLVHLIMTLIYLFLAYFLSKELWRA